MAVYYTLPRMRLYEKKKVKKLNDQPTNFERSFHKNWTEEIDSALGSDFQRKIVKKKLT